MDRALVAVLGAAVGCGVLLAVAVVKNERTFTHQLYAQERVAGPTAELAPASPPSPELRPVSGERKPTSRLTGQSERTMYLPAATR